MRIGKPLVIVGIVIFTAGIVFHFQGHGVVGPESSFMYTNPDWITYGFMILVIGAVILAIGLGLTIFKKY